MKRTKSSEKKESCSLILTDDLSATVTWAAVWLSSGLMEKSI